VTRSQPSDLELTLRPMTLSDLGLVAKWLREPHVSRWYLAGSTVEAEVEDLRRAVADEEPTHPLIVIENGRPIGWCQWYACCDYLEHAAGVHAEAGDIGIDYAIGDVERTGQGVGTAVVAALVDYVRRDHPDAGVVADPETANLASRRALEKNGFELVGEGSLPSEPTDAPMAVYRLALQVWGRRRSRPAGR
jgi:aminoglycoside 6'-N-acetyltransferase